MTQQHPITPPPELVEQWMQDHATKYDLVRQAAQWGADRQLEADAEWLDQNSLDASPLTITPTGKGLVEAMRPKPPTLKGQADTIRRALEQLPDSIVVFPSQC